MKMQKRKIWVKIFAIFFTVFFLASTNSSTLYAMTASQKAQVNAANQLAAQKKAEAAQKAKDAAAVQAQIAVIGGQINQTTAAINSTNQQIASTQGTINSLNQQISDKQDQITAENDKLNNFVADWYMQGESSLLQTILTSKNISDITTKQQYNDSIRQQIEIGIETLNNMKSDLANQKNTQTNQLASLDLMKSDQSTRQSYLQSSQSQQSSLLNYTQATIIQLNADAQKYAAEASRLQSLYSQVYSGGTPVGSGMVSPSSPMSWYYSQHSGAWSGVVINPKDSSGHRITFAQAGCYLTSLAMVANFYHHNVDPLDVFNAADVNPYSGDFGGKFPYGNIGISVAGSGNWDTVNNELNNGHPVIVSVRVPNLPVINADGSNHFIVIYGIINNVYQIQDPYWSNASYNISAVKSIKIIKSY